MKILLILTMLSGVAWAECVNYQQFNDIRRIAKSLPKGEGIRIILNNGEVIRGAFVSYVKYDDYIWFQPQGTTSVFSQDAEDVHNICNLAIDNA